jgi:hypothetical protein
LELTLEKLFPALSHPLSIVLISVSISAFLSYLISLRVQSRGLMYEMLKDHFDDLKNHVVKPWLKSLHKALYEMDSAEAVEASRRDYGWGELLLERGEELWFDLVHNHYPSLWDIWERMLALKEPILRLKDAIINRSIEIVREVVRQEGVEWPKLDEWREQLFKVALYYLDRPERIKDAIGAIRGIFPEYGGPGFEGVFGSWGTSFTLKLPIFAGSEEEAKKKTEAFISKLIEVMKSDEELQSLRERFFEGVVELKDRLTLMTVALRKILYKKNLKMRRRWGLFPVKCPYLREEIHNG